MIRPSTTCWFLGRAGTEQVVTQLILPQCQFSVQKTMLEKESECSAGCWIVTYIHPERRDSGLYVQHDKRHFAPSRVLARCNSLDMTWRSFALRRKASKVRISCWKLYCFLSLRVVPSAFRTICQGGIYSLAACLGAIVFRRKRSWFRSKCFTGRHLRLKHTRNHQCI